MVFVVVQGGDEPGGVVVVGDDEGAGAVGLFHAAGAADEDEPVDAEDFAGGKVGFVVDVVGQPGNFFWPYGGVIVGFLSVTSMELRLTK